MFELTQIILPVGDLDAALDFYVGTLGLSLKMRDGDRFAMVETGSVRLSLATESERSAEGGIALGFKVASLQDAADRLRRDGREVPETVEATHEELLEVQDPTGHPLVVYRPR